MMQQYIKELEHEPFAPEEFIERLAWRTLNDSFESLNGYFDPNLVHEAFGQAINVLHILEERQQSKCINIENAIKKQEAKYSKTLDLINRNKNTINLFHHLDERINLVATKVLHLGDQLESVNVPRSRAVEAQKLMNHFSEFLSPGPLNDPVFSQKESLNEAADIIQKLYVIAQELPNMKFEGVKNKISKKYEEVERNLIEEFVVAQRLQDVNRMTKLALVLSQFKGYSQCIDAFIEQSQSNSYGAKDVFQDIFALCNKNYSLMRQVFSNPEQVMAKFVLNIYHLRLHKYIVAKLVDKSDLEKYLQNLYDLYFKTVKLSNDLKKFEMGADETYLPKLTKNIFSKQLDTYITTEVKSLREKSAALLVHYYESKNHQKKQPVSGGFQELKRDIQAVLITRTNINIAQVENYGGETFLSEELAIALLQASKIALHRCALLSHSIELPANATQIFETTLQYLINEHVDYALELGLQCIPPESRTPPDIYFFTIVHQCNGIIRLLEEQFCGDLLPLVISTPKHADCVSKKKLILEQIEMKIDVGLDRSINAIVNWVKNYLQNEQRKTDFKPELEVFDTLNTPACLTVCQYISNMIDHIKDKLDGASLESVLTELGIRCHRVIYEHLLQYQFNSAGALCVICDINEYKKIVKKIGAPIVTLLFDTLHALCNLLLVKPENLKQVCSGDQLSAVDISILSTFIQLRADYKTQKLVNSLRGLAS